MFEPKEGSEEMVETMTHQFTMEWNIPIGIARSFIARHVAGIYT